MKIIYIGQAGLYIRLAGLHILVDPYLSDSCAAQNPSLHRRKPVEHFVWNIRPDVIICTHDHGDHLDMETLPKYITENTHVTVLTPSQGWAKVRTLGGANNYVQFNKYTEWTEGAVRFTAVGAVHSDPTAIGVVIEGEGKRLYITGDTLYSKDILADIQGRFDGVFLPVNGVGNNMNMADAARFAAQIDAKWVVPFHVGLFDNKDAHAFAAPNKIVPEYFKEVVLP